MMRARPSDRPEGKSLIRVPIVCAIFRPMARMNLRIICPTIASPDAKSMPPLSVLDRHDCSHLSERGQSGSARQNREREIPDDAPGSANKAPYKSGKVL